jgi:hypothetical protein
MVWVGAPHVIEDSWADHFSHYSVQHGVLAQSRNSARQCTLQVLLLVTCQPGGSAGGTGCQHRLATPAAPTMPPGYLALLPPPTLAPAADHPVLVRVVRAEVSRAGPGVGGGRDQAGVLGSSIRCPHSRGKAKAKGEATASGHRPQAGVAGAVRAVGEEVARGVGRMEIGAIRAEGEGLGTMLMVGGDSMRVPSRGAGEEGVQLQHRGRSPLARCFRGAGCHSHDRRSYKHGRPLQAVSASVICWSAH